jgi:hypothetical protein
MVLLLMLEAALRLVPIGIVSQVVGWQALEIGMEWGWFRGDVKRAQVDRRVGRHRWQAVKMFRGRCRLAVTWTMVVASLVPVQLLLLLMGDS